MYGVQHASSNWMRDEHRESRDETASRPPTAEPCGSPQPRWCISTCMYICRRHILCQENRREGKKEAGTVAVTDIHVQRYNLEAKPASPV